MDGEIRAELNALRLYILQLEERIEILESITEQLKPE